MSKRRPFWFWNTAVLARLAWLLLAAAYASRALGAVAVRTQKMASAGYRGLQRWEDELPR